ncbi:MAG: RNA polymerase sigma factor [Bacteroidales bacterium]|nr:RNA polymerase sigma factor [Bacteroidales bacterium]
MSEISNEKILAFYKTPEQKEKGFSLLLKKYEKQIYWHVRHMVVIHEDTDDLVQDIFLKIWKNLKKFKGDSDLYTWIYRIATNETLSYINKKKKKYFSSIEENLEAITSSPSDTNSMSGEEIQQRLQRAMISLPPQQRTVFELKYFQEMKYEDMAKILEVTTGALKASYHHAVKKIKENVQVELNLNNE